LQTKLTIAKVHTRCTSAEKSEHQLSLGKWWFSKKKHPIRQRTLSFYILAGVLIFFEGNVTGGNQSYQKMPFPQQHSM